MGLVVAFNSSENPVQADEVGHAIEPHNWGVVDEEFVAGDLAAERLLLVDLSSVKEGDSNPAVIMAKKELEERERLAKPAAVEPAEPDEDPEDEVETTESEADEE